MIESAITSGLIEIFLAAILASGAMIVAQRDLLSLVSTYAFQSLILSAIAIALFFSTGNITLILIAALTIISKVVIIPYFIKSVQKSMKIKRDTEFKFLTPNSALLVTIILILLVANVFSKVSGILSLGRIEFFGVVLGVSLMVVGLIVTFTRKKVITNIIGYLTIENGVLLFSIFVAELPFLIEVLIMVDLIMLVLLSVMLAIGIDSNLEEFAERIGSLPLMRDESDEL